MTYYSFDLEKYWFLKRCTFFWHVPRKMYKSFFNSTYNKSIWGNERKKKSLRCKTCLINLPTSYRSSQSFFVLRKKIIFTSQTFSQNKIINRICRTKFLAISHSKLPFYSSNLLFKANFKFKKKLLKNFSFLFFSLYRFFYQD